MSNSVPSAPHSKLKVVLLSSGALAIGTVAVLSLDDIFDLDGGMYNAATWSVAITFGLLIGLIVARYYPEESESQRESQARVREAERGLEDALRGHFVLVSAPGASAGTPVLVSGDPSVDTDEDTERPAQTRMRQVPGDQQSRLTLSELWAVTHRRLDHYHGIALGQAKQSFRNAQIAMTLGFSLLVTFVIVGLNSRTTAGSIVAGALGTVSAALAGYVSRTFIRSQETAAGHLRAYFDQPLEFSRYLAAERLITDAGLSNEKRAEILNLLVQTVLAGPGGLTSASSSEEQPPKTP
jgi:hypothetical protein